jgi:hypothetical protein
MSPDKALKSTFNILSSSIIEKQVRVCSTRARVCVCVCVCGDCVSQIESGTTALVTVFVANDLYVANCGDARAVLVRYAHVRASALALIARCAVS